MGLQNAIIGPVDPVTQDDTETVSEHSAYR